MSHSGTTFVWLHEETNPCPSVAFTQLLIVLVDIERSILTSETKVNTTASVPYNWKSPVFSSASDSLQSARRGHGSRGGVLGGKPVRLLPFNLFISLPCFTSSTLMETELCDSPFKCRVPSQASKYNQRQSYDAFDENISADTFMPLVFILSLSLRSRWRESRSSTTWTLCPISPTATGTCPMSSLKSRWMTCGSASPSSRARGGSRGCGRCGSKGCVCDVQI